MQKCKLTAHVSTKLNRSHLIMGERALILPCLGRTEEDLQATGKQFVTVEDSMAFINPSRGFFEPASPDLMSDVAILCNLAHVTLGSRTTTHWLGFAADYNLIRDAISRVIRHSRASTNGLPRRGSSICRMRRSSTSSKRVPGRQS